MITTMPNGAGYRPEIEDVWDREIVEINNLTEEQYSRLENAFFEEGLASTDEPDEVEKWIAFLSEREAKRLLNLY
jgi:hypothetical protein